MRTRLLHIQAMKLAVVSKPARDFTFRDGYQFHALGKVAMTGRVNAATKVLSCK